MPLDGFDDRNLISDYNFLEEAAQLAEAAQRSRQRASRTHSTQSAQARQLQHEVWGPQPIHSLTWS